MFKSQLQEMCQKRKWGLPTYSSTRDGGPHHAPTFKASVLVNGLSFQSPDSCKSFRETQNQAARIAYNHFISFDSSSGSPSARTILNNITNDDGLQLNKSEDIPKSTPSDEKLCAVKNDQDLLDASYMYKMQLQNYAQKRNLSLPVYSSVCEGLPHVARFKVVVTVDGQTFESPGFFHTLREAEHSAAKVAFCSLSKDGIQQDGCGFYKNLLQDLACKEGLNVPFYTTKASGASHVPIFTSTVHVENADFHGVEAKSKKQAEINAAKVAYFFLKERQLRRNPAPLYQSDNAQALIDRTSPSLDTTIVANLLQKLNVKDENQGANSGEDQGGHSDEIVANREKITSDQSKLSPIKPGSSEPGKSRSSLPNIIHESMLVSVPQVSSSQDGSTSSTTVLECCNHVDAKQNSDMLAAPYTLLCNRVRVYSHKPELKFPKGVTILPISDDKWVAVSLEFPNEQGYCN